MSYLHEYISRETYNSLYNNYVRCSAENADIKQNITILNEVLRESDENIANLKNSLQNCEIYKNVLIQKLQSIGIPIPRNPASYDDDSIATTSSSTTKSEPTLRAKNTVTGLRRTKSLPARLNGSRKNTRKRTRTNS
jgi:hypothetical protein